MLRRCASMVRGLRNIWLAACLVLAPAAMKRATLTAGFRLALLAATALAALGAVATLTLVHGAPPRTHDGDIPQVHDASTKAA